MALNGGDWCEVAAQSKWSIHYGICARLEWREVAERYQDMAWASHSMAEQHTDLSKTRMYCHVVAEKCHGVVATRVRKHSEE